MGGRIALATALAARFRGLILESASPGLVDPAVRDQRRQSDNILADRIECDGIPAFVAYWEHIPLFASQRNLPQDKQAKLHAQRLRNIAQGLANSLRGVGTGAQPALHNRLSELTQPTLLLTGSLDQKFSQIAQEMACQLPLAQHSIVPDAGHTTHLEQPEIFATLVNTFLKHYHMES
jgi:2-succinyl-6-hydroxy-2,4-cyclohexadiene-1-carboxylate synthase